VPGTPRAAVRLLPPSRREPPQARDEHGSRADRRGNRPGGGHDV